MTYQPEPERVIAEALRGIAPCQVDCDCLARQLLEALEARYLLVSRLRPADEDQVQLACHNGLPGLGRCRWTGSGADADWCAYYEEWVCPKCGESDTLRIVGADDRPPCVECGRPASLRLNCRHPICEDCYARTYQDGCAACDGHATWCRLATRPVNLTPEAHRDEAPALPMEAQR